MKNTDFQKNADSKTKKMAAGIKIIFICLNLFVLTFAMFFSNINAQEVVDEAVAMVSVGEESSVIARPELLSQLAMQPGVPLDPPTSADLKRALQLLINQRVIGLRVPREPRLWLSAPTQKEIDTEIKRVLAQFPSIAEFEKRLRIVGFDSEKDEDFERIIAIRVQIQKYLDIAFRSRVVIAPEDEARYYREVFVPDFRRRNPGILMPTLDEKRPQINQILTEPKVASDIEKYLESAKRLAEIVILNDEWKF